MGNCRPSTPIAAIGSPGPATSSKVKPNAGQGLAKAGGGSSFEESLINSVDIDLGDF